jgi:hypothetical protein
MSYKFQLGSAVYSGSLKLEDQLEAAGGIKLNVDGAHAMVVGDDILFQDSDGTMKREGVGDFMTLVAGDGLGVASSQLKINVDDETIETNSDGIRIKDGGVDADALASTVAGDGLTGGGGSVLAVGAGALLDVQANQVDVDLTEAADATVAHGDFLIFLDGGTSGAASKGSTADLATLFAAGDGLVASNSSISVQVSGAVKLASDKVGISGSIAGAALTFEGGADSISKLDVAVNSTSFAIASDEIQLKSNVAGDGLALSSHILSVNVDDSTLETSGDALRLKNDGVTGAKLAPDVAAGGLTQDGSGNLQVGAGSLIDVQADQVDVDLTEAADATVAHGDFLIFLDGGTSGAASKGSTADLATLFAAGDGLVASNSSISVQVSGAIKVASDKVGISGSFAGNGLTFEGGADSISSIAVNANSTSFAINSDSLELASGVAGDGLALSSHVLSVNVDDETIETNSDTLRIKDGGVDADALASSVAGVGLSGGAGTALALDLNELSAAVVDVAADSIAIIDAGDNSSKKESIADFVGQLPATGGGLSADGGKLTVAHAVDTFGDDTNAFEFGLNVQTVDFTASRTKALPTPVAGRTVVIKGKNTGTFPMTIQVANTGTQKIDGSNTSILLESEGGAVTLMCVSTTKWIIV